MIKLTHTSGLHNFILSLAFALIAAGTAQANEQIGEGTLLALDDHYACIDVTLRDGKNYPFILDTGAFRTLVLEEFGQSQKLSVVNRSNMGSIGASNQRRKLYELGEVIVGGARWPQIRAISIPLKSLPCAPGINAVGALGMDFLSQPVVEFDFPNRKFRIFQPRSFRYSGRGTRIGIVKKGQFVNRLGIGVAVTSAHGIAMPLTLVLDTGAPGSVLSLSHGAGIDLGLYQLPHAVAAGGGANGERHSTVIVRAPEVRFGSDVMANALVVVHEAKRGSAAVRQGDSGLLGLGWAKHRRWFLDYQHDQIFIEPGPVIQPVAKIGVNAWFDQDAPGKPWILTRTQIKGGVGLPRGLRLGDQLLSINGKSNFDPGKDAPGTESAWSALNKAEEVTFEIQRGGKTRSVNITPTELLPMNAATTTLDDTPPHIP